MAGQLTVLFSRTDPNPVQLYYKPLVKTTYQVALYLSGVQVGSRTTFVATDDVGLPAFDNPAPGIYTARVFSADGLTLIRESAPFTVPAQSAATPTPTPAPTPAPTPTPTPTPAPTSTSDSTLTGLPSTIVAGQSLSAVTYTPPQTSIYFVLYKVPGAIEEGLRWPSAVMPGALTLLVPQTAGAYTVRGYDAPTAGNKVYESAQINVTAAPGPLPATPAQAADTNRTSSAVTTNWSATAASYHVLARPGIGTVYGSLADATVTTNSYTFTGLAASSSPRAIVIPQNANGYGTLTGQFLSFTTA